MTVHFIGAGPGAADLLTVRATRLLAAELSRLAALVPELDREETRAALAELAACFPVYRGYPPEGVRHLAAARSEAGRRRPDLTATLDAVTARLRDHGHELAARFPQLTGAVMAKGVEDTAYYRWTRFVALNEVGGTPAQVALAWLLAQGDDVVPIPGTKRVSRLEENVGAADLTLTPDQVERLSALPLPTGDRYPDMSSIGR